MTNTSPQKIDLEKVSIEDPQLLKKLQKVEDERKLLLARLADTKLIGVKERVAFILNLYPETRNSDVDLAFRYWNVFDADYVSGDFITREAAMQVTRQGSLRRARAKIQNEYGLFQATEEVRQERRSKAEDESAKQLADKPSGARVSFYLDESSKNSRYAIVGGLCSLGDREAYSALGHFREWRLKNNIEYEFHFTNMSKHRLEAYKEFFREAMKFSHSFGFKAIVFDQSSGKKRTSSEIIRELYYQLIYQGIEHEIAMKRIKLPRPILIKKDKEKGFDALEMTRVRQELSSAFGKDFSGELVLEDIEAIDSTANNYIQLADLFIGSLARSLNRGKSANRNHKDELADYILGLLGIDVDLRKAPQDFVFFQFLE